MLLFDVTFDTGEENEIGRKHRTWLKNNSRRKVEYSRGMVDKWRNNSLFQDQPILVKSYQRFTKFNYGVTRTIYES